MVIQLALMLFTTGFPTGVCVVRSRLDNLRKGKDLLMGVKAYKTAHRGHTPGPHST